MLYFFWVIFSFFFFFVWFLRNYESIIGFSVSTSGPPFLASNIFLLLYYCHLKIKSGTRKGCMRR